MKSIKLKVTIPVARCELVAMVANWLDASGIGYDSMLAHAKRQWPNQKVLMNKIKDHYEAGIDTREISCTPGCWDVAEALIDRRFQSLKEDE